MLIFQVQKEEDRPEHEKAHFGMRARPKNPAPSEQSLSVLVESVAAELMAPFVPEKEKEVSDFVATLTPGAQNAIRAASFAWGYENASRYVKNAMKLDEVKNADNSPEKSNAVIHSLQSQAAEEHDVSKFAWGYYNEDMKETQAQAGKSEAITGSSRQKEPEQEKERERLQMPLGPQEAVGISITSGTLVPSVLCCANSYNDAVLEQERLSVEQKRLELAALMENRPTEGGKPALAAEKETLARAMEIAEERKKQQEEEFEKAEKALKDAIAAIDAMKREPRGLPKRISAMLPDELSRYILSHERKLSKRRAMRSQLAKWAVFCSAGRKALSAMPPSKLLKLVSLSSLLRRR